MTQTIKDRILQYLNQYRNGIDDDELTSALNIHHRQQVNSRCRQLAKEGAIDRRPTGGKIKNFWKDSVSIPSQPDEQRQSIINKDEPWFWEGNIQTSVCSYLAVRGYLILRCANTKSRHRGKDIEARSKSSILWITVKGYPKGTPKTEPSTQAGHWFKQALFDVISWRDENGSAEIGMAFPDYPRYRNLVLKIIWLQPIARFSIFWVSENGIVQTQKIST